MAQSTPELTELAARSEAFKTAFNLLVKNHRLEAVSAKVDIPANGQVEYDLPTKAGVTVGDPFYNWGNPEVSVLVKDTAAGSATLNMYVSAEAVVVQAMRADRYLRLINNTGAVISVNVRVSVPRNAAYVAP